MYIIYICIYIYMYIIYIYSGIHMFLFMHIYASCINVVYILCPEHKYTCVKIQIASNKYAHVSNVHVICAYINIG
jgi:hypothetical protein